MLIEGARIRYVGGPQGVLRANDCGRLLSISGDGGHVLFSTGKAAGRVQYLPLAQLMAIEAAERSLLADSLDAPPPISVTAVRETVASSGEEGLIHALGEAGVLDDLATIAEEAADFVAGRVRSDPSLAPVMAVLDTEEQDQVVSLASALLLRNAAHYDPDGDDG